MSRTRELELHFHAGTGKAMRLSLTGDDTQAEWVPRSQIEVLDLVEPDKGDTVNIEIPEWLAKQKGFL